MDELFEWTHIQGPSPDMTHVVSFLCVLYVQSTYPYITEYLQQI